MAAAYRVRPAVPSDVEALPALEVAAASLFRASAHPEAADAPAVSVEEFRRALAHGGLWVAVRDAITVGFALAEVETDNVHLEEIDVHPDHGRHGLGARLLLRVCDWARARGCSTVTLTTFDDVAWNRAFYERHGFRVLDAQELSESLQARMRAEAGEGLVDARVAMQRDLRDAPQRPTRRRESGAVKK